MQKLLHSNTYHTRQILSVFSAPPFFTKSYTEQIFMGPSVCQAVAYLPDDTDKMRLRHPLLLHVEQLHYRPLRN